MDPGGFQQKTIALVIKTPSQGQEDQTVEGVDLNWTVRDLKAHLSTVYPTAPLVSDQRLIYAGKLLPDHLHIRDLFKQTDSIPTLHLVCAARTSPIGPLGARPKAGAAEQLHPQPRSSSSSTVQSAMPSPNSSPRPTLAPASPSPSTSSRVQGPVVSPSVPTAPELRQRRPVSPAPGPTQTPASAPGSPAWPDATMPEMPAFPTYSLYSPQQLLWLQHIYARQYYMQYHAALAAAGTASLAPAATIGPYPPVPAHQAPVPAPLPNQNPIDNLPANQNPGQDGAFINPGAANQNMRMNAQGGPVMEDEEDMDRDWLDWMYSAARLGVLLMIVYFNSSMSRFVLVMSTLLLMYLHTAGWFPFRRRALVQGPNPQQPPEAPMHNQQEQNRNPDPAPAEELADGEREEGPAAAAAAAAAAGEGSDGQGPMTAVLVPPHRVSIMWTAWVFFKTFFSSLIPEGPQGVVN